jgi:hypothetical protein
MPDETDDYRIHRRYILQSPLSGSFGAIAVGIVNVGCRGVQVVHGVPLKPGARSRFTVSIAGRGEKIALSGTVVWSRFSKDPDQAGKLLYRSGIHFEEGSDFPQEALQLLEAQGLARVDEEALQRKREALDRKRQQRQQSQTAMPIRTAPDIPPEQVLLIQHARDQLRGNPEEAQKWYRRARFSPPVVDGKPIPYREDVIAIWEYLQRSIDIHVVAKVFGDLK